MARMFEAAAGWLGDLPARARRLLPPVVEPGTMPFMSLFYLIFPLLPAVLTDFPRPDWVLTGLAIATFLPLYFGFYWMRGWRRVAVLFAIAAIGCALFPANTFSNTFVIYANVLAAFLSLRAMVGVVVTTQVAMALVAATIQPPKFVYFYVVVNLMTGVISSICNRFWIVQARNNQALRLSQDEVQRLARVAERERIGRDLHDVLGHTLSVVALKSELAVRLFDRDPQAAANEMREVERVAREALGQVRRAVAGMRALGLRAEFANARLALAAVEVDFEYRADDLALHPEIETALALALREAATNVIRHAGARRCRADLGRAGDDVALSIVDDGLGGARTDGNGLRGMRERIEALGGRLEIVSDSGLGTQLSIRVPYRAPEEQGARTETPAARKLAVVR